MKTYDTQPEQPSHELFHIAGEGRRSRWMRICESRPKGRAYPGLTLRRKPPLERVAFGPFPILVHPCSKNIRGSARGNASQKQSPRVSAVIIGA